MKSILFFVNLYWELHWLHNVISSLNADVYTTNDVCEEYCKRNGFNVVKDWSNYSVVAVTNFHLGEQWNIVSNFKKTGGYAVVLQHAWDSALHLKQDFWGRDMGKFDRYFVGSTQDFEWLSEKYGTDRVVLTGIPKLDDLYKVKNSKKNLEKVYKNIGVNDFLLSIAPSSAISDVVMREYEFNLEPNSIKPIVYKSHPGGDHDSAIGYFKEKGRDIRLIADDCFDRFNTYEVIKASSGVVCLESFLSIEASLLEKPVVFWGKDSLPNNFYNMECNINQIYRAPSEMSSSLTNLQYTQKQKEISSMYLFDGKNTERTIQALREFLND